MSKAAEVSMEISPEGCKIMAFSEGEVGLDTCRGIEHCFASNHTNGDQRVFGLRVPFLDSEAIKSIIAAVQTARRGGGEAAIICNEQEARCAYRILCLLDIESCITVIPDTEAALRMLDHRQ